MGYFTENMQKSFLNYFEVQQGIERLSTNWLEKAAIMASIVSFVYWKAAEMMVKNKADRKCERALEWMDMKKEMAHAPRKHQTVHTQNHQVAQI